MTAPAGPCSTRQRITWSLSTARALVLPGPLVGVAREPVEIGGHAFF
jgi:hypothetical protein